MPIHHPLLFVFEDFCCSRSLTHSFITRLTHYTVYIGPAPDYTTPIVISIGVAVVILVIVLVVIRMFSKPKVPTIDPAPAIGGRTAPAAEAAPTVSRMTTPVAVPVTGYSNSIPMASETGIHSAVTINVEMAKPPVSSMSAPQSVSMPVATARYAPQSANMPVATAQSVPQSVNTPVATGRYI